MHKNIEWWFSDKSYIIDDCVEYLTDIPDNTVNLVLTDPPYNISQRGSKIGRGSGKFVEGSDINLDFGDWDYRSVLPIDYVDEFVRILKPNGVLVMFYEQLGLGVIGKYLENTYDVQNRHLGVWTKSNPPPQARKVNWMQGSEKFLVTTMNQGTGHHFNYELGQSSDYFKHSVTYKHYHPTQKPLDLIKWIMKYWSFEDDIVLDPFLGSGTTLVAAKELRRTGIGFEKDDTMDDIISMRLEEANPSPSITSHS